MVAAPINLISLDYRGVAYITGTRIKVAQIARETTALKYTPEDIIDSHSHLTHAQIHAALSYFYSHREEIESYLREQDAYYEQFCAEHPHGTSLEELEARRSSASRSESAPGGVVASATEEGILFG